MKKIVIVAVFIFLINKTFSQKYQPVDSTTVWATEFVYKINGSCYVQENERTYIKGYSLNNGNKWLRLFSSQKSNWHPNSPIQTCVNMSNAVPAPFFNYANGFVLNDSLNKKVYFKNSLPLNYTPTNADVLYDYNNKVVGDTLYVFGNNGSKFKINTIDSFLFTGKYHKRFTTTYLGSTIYNNLFSFTEGIGSSIHPFSPSINPMGEQYKTLLCFASPTQTISLTSHTVFTNGNLGCANLSLNNVSVKETEQFDLSIYPNPASDHISVVLEQNSAVGTIYKVVNLLGQEQLTGTLKETKNDIDLVSLKRGIYFGNFYKNDRFVLCKKIVIQ